MNAGWNWLKPGLMTIKMPMKPTTMASARRQPTYSPSIGPASAATTSGARNAIDDRLIETQILNGKKIADPVVAAMRHDRSNLQSRAFAFSVAPESAVRAENRHHHQDLTEKSDPHDLRRRHAHVLPRYFAVGVQAREQRDRRAHQQDGL